MPRTPRHRRQGLSSSLLALACVGLWACGGGTGGCGAMTPIPSGRYEGPRTENAVNIRLSPGGVTYLNQNWQTLLQTFAPGGEFRAPLACNVQSLPVVGDVVLADQGGANCTEESCGQMDGQCDADDVPAQIPLRFTDLSLVPQGPDTLAGMLSVTVDTGNIYLSSVNRRAGVCLVAGALKCRLRFNSAGTAPGQNSLEVKVKFSIDNRWEKLLSFQIASVDGMQVCGSDGAQPKPRCFDPDDLAIAGENACGTVYCGGANIGFIKGILLRSLSPVIQNQLQSALGNSSCRACDANNPCPDIAGASSTCNATGFCIDDSTQRCVPRTLGVEGRITPAALAGSFGIPESAQLDVSVKAGGSVQVDQGVSLGTFAGARATAPAACVPTVAAPQVAAAPPPSLDASASPGSKYHMGIAVSRPFLDSTLHEAQQSGALCMNLSSTQVGLLNTGLMKTFLPSLGKLATRDGQDAPMMVVMRPQKPPTVQVGAGTYDPTTKRPIQPLLTLGLTDLTVDFYAMLDDRFIRLFSLTADIKLPLSLVFEGCSSVTPALGDLKQLVTNIRAPAAFNEMLSEDLSVLEDLIPVVIGFAEPALASALKPFDLPDLGAFKLRVNEAKGIDPISGADGFHHLALYAELLPAAAQCAVAGPPLMAKLVQAHIPKAEELRLQGRPLPWPTATVRVEMPGTAPTDAEYAWRIDGGLWTDFVPARGGTLDISHPAFLLQGTHQIEVRARSGLQPTAVSLPVALGFTVDWTPPNVSLKVDRAANRLQVSANDAVTPRESLRYSYRVGGDEASFSALGPSREVDLSAVEAAGGFAVKVVDLAGNEAMAVHRLPVEMPLGIVERTGEGDAVWAAQSESSGCSSAGGALTACALLAVAALFLERRRRKD